MVNTLSSNAPISTKIESSIGTGLLTAAPMTGPAAPFVAIAGLAALLMAKFGVGAGCGQTCIVTSNWANQAAALLQQNVDTYTSLPTPRAESAQAAALANFDSIWSFLVQQCSAPSLGTAGKNCIGDRQAGACHYKNDGVCWNWFTGYRDPIANDPNVVPDTVVQSAQAAVSSVAGGVQSAATALSVSPAILLAGAAILLGVMLT